MSYSKNQNKQEWVDVARLSLWAKESKNGNKFLSGVFELEDGRKVSIRIFSNHNKKQENSPDYYGFGQVPEDKVHEILQQEEPEPEKMVSDLDEIPFDF